MRTKLCAIGLAAALVCACSSTSKNQTIERFPMPPGGPKLDAQSDSDPIAIDHQLEMQLRENNTEAMRFLVRYRQAQLWSPLDHAKACTLWLQVTDNPRFPLVRVARLRAVETCPANRSEVASFVNSLTTDAEPWLREAALRATLARAIDAGDRAGELKLTMAIAPLEPVQATQVKRLEHARDLAKYLKDDASGAQVQTALELLAPRFISQPPPEKYLLVATDFRRARDFEHSREYYRKIVDGADFTDLEKLKALDGIRMTFKLEQNHERYLEATHAYSDFAHQKFFAAKTKRGSVLLGKYVETRLQLARAVWTENSAKEANAILLKLEKEIGNRFPLEESRFLRARIAEEAGHLDEAVKIIEHIDEARLGDRALRQKIAWYRAWNLRKIGRLKEAAELLKKLAAAEEASSLLARDRFWLGRTLKEAGDLDGANAEFKWLTENDPIGYYGTIAYREMAQRLPRLGAAAGLRTPADVEPPSVTPTPPLRASSPDLSNALFPEERLTFEWLSATGENDLARRFLDQISAPRRASFSETQTLDYLQLYARAGAYQSLFGRLSDLPADVRRDILGQKPELLFPRPWSGLIDGASRKYAVAPELILSIMRQESSFNPRARSFADAFGLMQLIPEMAHVASQTSGVAFHANEDLYKPEINIPLGASFLKRTLNLWDGKFVPAVASYNASQKAVTGWLRTRNRKDALQFIEDIPYEETKAYVKLVMRNYVFYSRLTTTSDAIDFPEWCLAGLQDIKP